MIGIKILDLFCGMGGAAMGLYQACLDKKVYVEITGVDLKYMKDYPFNFIQDDVFNFVENTDLDIYDFIWASPPCQRYSVLKNVCDMSSYGDFCDETHDILVKSDKPYVIENVPQAPIRKDLMLCGEMFGMRIIRHRIFELDKFKILQPAHINHKPKGYYTTVSGHNAGIKKYQEVMEIHWASNQKQLSEAVPPRYSKYIMHEFLNNYYLQIYRME